MDTPRLEPGHYVHFLYDNSFEGPYSREQAYTEARRFVDLDISEPYEMDIIHIAEVLVFPETLPKGGE